jgi:hypothetical protein
MLSSLQWPENCYNKILQYVDLTNNKQLNLKLDYTADIYASKSYIRTANNSLFTKLTNIITSYIVKETDEDGNIIAWNNSVELSGIYVPNILLKQAKNSLGCSFNANVMTIQNNLNDSSMFIVKHNIDPNNYIKIMYKDLLINMENILHNYGYNLEYYYTPYDKISGRL